MQVREGFIPRGKPVRIAVDAVAVLLCYTLALAIRFEFTIPGKYFGRFFPVLPAIVIAYLLGNYALRIYSERWKYASFDELLALTSAATLSTVVVLVTIAAIPEARTFVPLSVVIIGGVLSLVTMAFVRLQYRVVGEWRMRKGVRGGKRLLLAGAGEAGEMVVRDVQRHPEHNYLPVGFVDDNPKKHNLVVQGVPVLGGTEDIARIIKERSIDEVFITMPSAPGSKVEQIARSCEGTGAKIKILPGIFLTMAGEIGVNSVRELELEDLLGREPVETDLESISAYVKGKTVMVTGAGGSIGSELCRQLRGLGPDTLLAVDQDSTALFELEMELARDGESGDGPCPVEVVVANIRDRGRLDAVFGRYRPNVVFHSAALKHVPMMESNPSEAVKNNIQGTRNLIEAGVKHNLDRSILISTDKAVHPVSVMGATKRIAEMLVGHYNGSNGTRLTAVRFGNVLGSRGSVVPIFKKQIEAGGPVLVTHPEATRYFMTMSEAAQLVMQAGAFTEGGDVFILDMGEPVRILDLASKMVRLMGNGNGSEIEIRTVGLRPGEKLHEQLVLPVEEMTPTRHSKINKALQNNGHLPDFEKQVDALVEAAERNADLEVRIMLSSFIDGDAEDLYITQAEDAQFRSSEYSVE